MGLSFNPLGHLYAVNNTGDTLFRINPATGAQISSVSLSGTQHSSGNPFPGEINSIEFGPDGTLYGIGFGLYSINVTSGVASRITPFGYHVSGAEHSAYFGGLDFGGDGVLRAISATSQSEFWVVDPFSGIGQLVGPIGDGDFGDIASVVPEPGVLSLLAPSALMFLPRRKGTVG